MGQFTKPVTDATFESDVLKSSTPVLVDFWAEWCAPCRALAPTLEEIAEELSTQVKIVKLDVDANQDAAAQFGIRSIPTMILFKGSLWIKSWGKFRKPLWWISFLNIYKFFRGILPSIQKLQWRGK
jgi:thioredoxin 1